MAYPDTAWERAMKVQEVMLKALSGEIHWFRAAEILGLHPRSLRRWRERYEAHGYDGLIDKRYQRPSQRRVPIAEVERVLRLYRERSAGFNVRHFHEFVRRAHGITLSYSYVKQALKTAGLVTTRRARGRHYRRREPRAFHTPRAKGPVDKTRLTQVGRALARLGIEHIPAYSPQARGRSERLHRTFQDRLVNERRVAGITTLEAANAYLANTFLPHYNATFTRPPREEASAFVPLEGADLDRILCHEEERVVSQDNVVTFDRQVLPLAPRPTALGPV